MGILVAEALLHTPLGARIPEADRWGNDGLAAIIKDSEEYAQSGPVDVLFFGSSQGVTWIDQQDLRTRGLRAFNASVRGCNTVLADLLGSRIFLPKLQPKVVVITLGPMSLSAWNQHFVLAVEGSAVGGPILRGDTVDAWINENIMLIRKGGHTIGRPAFQAWKHALLGEPELSETSQTPEAKTSEPIANLPIQLGMFRSYRRDQAQFEALQHLRQAAEASGARVLFVNMPAKDVAKQGASWNYDDYLSELKRVTAGYPLLDLDALANDGHFIDYTHPSPAGRIAMRAAVGDFVGKYLPGAQSQ